MSEPRSGSFEDKAARYPGFTYTDGEAEEPELYYGPPTANDYCAYRYKHKKFAPENLRCPNHVSFYVKIPDGRGPDWRKARASCLDHLGDVVWLMQADHGTDGELYDGEYLLRASRL